MQQQQNIKPRYEVEDRTDEMIVETHIKRVKAEDGVAHNEEHEVEVPYGYDVFFPAGHSMRVRTKAELIRLGFHEPAELIDEDGEVVGSTAQHSLKKNVQHRAAASKRRKAHTTSIDANQGG